MSTNYFILSKRKNDNINDNNSNQIVQLAPNPTYLLPSNNHAYYAQYGLFESGLIEWCKQFCKPDGAFLDIGAHTGTYAISLAPYVKTVYAFEPQKSTYYALCGGVALSGFTNVECLRCGLGNEAQKGDMTLNIVSDDGGGSTVHMPANESVLRKEVIQIKMLDQFKFDERIDFIKMDVEENELQVLQGAVDTLDENGWPKILFESNRENPELFGFLEYELGYSIVKLHGVSNMFLATKN